MVRWAARWEESLWRWSRRACFTITWSCRWDWSVCAMLAVIVLWNVASKRAPGWSLRVLHGDCASGVLAGYLARNEHEETKDYPLDGPQFLRRAARSRRRTSNGYPGARTAARHHQSRLASAGCDKLRYVPTSYYGVDSGVGRAIRAVQDAGPVRVGVIGLGAGVLSTYGRAGDYYRIYEINPLVRKYRADAVQLLSAFARRQTDPDGRRAADAGAAGSQQTSTCWRWTRFQATRFRFIC